MRPRRQGEGKPKSKVVITDETIKVWVDIEFDGRQKVHYGNGIQSYD
jgi:hypothetical protein